ncbi:MAG: VanZ family protein [Armatimonas sp.]
MKQARWILLWLALIFATSCTVVPFDVFVRFVGNLGGPLWNEQGVRNIWGGVWLFCVKGWHFTEYAIATTLGERALRSRIPDLKKRLGLVLFIVIAFAASDEWDQTFVPERGGNVRDVLIDSAGALTAAFWLWKRRLSRPSGGKLEA